MTLWERIAFRLTHDTIIDWEERFFVCPECGEPIYEDDWRESDYTLGRTFDGNYYCPVCEVEIV